MFHWMEAIALVHSSLQLKMMKTSSTTKKLLMAFGIVIVGMDVTAAVFEVYGIRGVSVQVVGIVYSIWSLLMAGVSLYTSHKLRGVIAKIHTVTDASSKKTQLGGNDKSAVTSTATSTGTAVTSGTKKDNKDNSSTAVLRPDKHNKGTSSSPRSTSPRPSTDGKNAPNKENKTVPKSRNSEKFLVGIGEKLQHVLFYVNVSAALLIVAVIASALMGLDVRYVSTTALAIVTHLPLITEIGVSLSDMIILSKSMDSTNQ